MYIYIYIDYVCVNMHSVFSSSKSIALVRIPYTCGLGNSTKVYVRLKLQLLGVLAAVALHDLDADPHS